MLRITEKEIWRGGNKVGYIERDKYILSKSGKRLGYFDKRYVYNVEGTHLAYIDGNHMYLEDSGGDRVSLDKVNEEIIGGLLPMMGKCAIYILIGV